MSGLSRFARVHGGMGPGGRVANRLARESSPYLLLHAENPVDWYPWGEEAFEAAHREDKPIFVSVGYSTCYWCHVMERECFSHEEIARQMNEGFVCIKVDREERPDIDEIYMAATQLLTRSGGWPNSVFLTPERKPFFAGTYFPPRDLHGRPGFPRVLQSLREAWLLQRAEVLQQAEMITRAMGAYLAPGPGGGASRPAGDLAAAAQDALAARFDPEWGGFGPAPKFPSPANLYFLLDRAADEEARGMLIQTLDRMARGGVMDQLAGGFHRYSTDDMWRVPHFEKMLYDNAALGRLYAEASLLAPGAGFERVARLTLDFVLREMRGPEGAFVSAIDAETDGREGIYYTWTEAELGQILPKDNRALFRAAYGLDGSPNFESDRYVLHLALPLAEQGRRAGLGEEELVRRLEGGRKALLEARARRARPLVDDKILADWNGLMIGALARAGALFREPRYIEAARRAAGFVLGRMADPSTSELRHSLRDGRGRVPALLDDYAFLVEGLLCLHAATGEGDLREEAVRLAEQQERRLADSARGGYFAAGEDPQLLFRAKPGFDGAVASGNGVSALNLIQLGRLTGEAVWGERAEALLLAFADGMAEAPLAHLTLVRAAARLVVRPRVEPASGASAADALEDEARESVEVEGRLGRGADEGWKPFTLDLEIRRGFHLNPNPSSDRSRPPTAVRPVVGAIRSVRYPAGESLGEGGPAAYHGRIRIAGEIEHRGGGAPAIELSYQACDDVRCLPPVSRLVRLT